MKGRLGYFVLRFGFGNTFPPISTDFHFGFASINSRRFEATLTPLPRLLALAFVSVCSGFCFVDGLACAIAEPHWNGDNGPIFQRKADGVCCQEIIG